MCVYYSNQHLNVLKNRKYKDGPNDHVAGRDAPGLPSLNTCHQPKI